MPEVDILIRAKNRAKAEFGKFHRDIKNYERRIKASFASIKAAAFSMRGVVAGAGLLLGSKAMISAYDAQEKAVMGLSQALKQAGRYTPQLQKSLTDLASQIQKEGIFGDEAIIETQKILVQFGKISDDMLPRATKAVTDLAAATGMDLKPAAELVAKASSGVMDTLSRYGIVLPDAVKKSKDFSAILSAIEGRVGGMNRALSVTSGGAAIKFRNALGDIAEQGGKALMTGLHPILLLIQGDIENLSTKTVATKETILNASEWMVAAAGRIADGWKVIKIAALYTSKAVNTAWMAQAKGIRAVLDAALEVSKRMPGIAAQFASIKIQSEINGLDRAINSFGKDIKVVAAEIADTRIGSYAEEWAAAFAKMRAEMERDEGVTTLKENLRGLAVELYKIDEAKKKAFAAGPQNYLGGFDDQASKVFEKIVTVRDGLKRLGVDGKKAWSDIWMSVVNHNRALAKTAVVTDAVSKASAKAAEEEQARMAAAQKNAEDLKRTYMAIGSVISNNVMNAVQQFIEAGRSTADGWRKAILSIIAEFARMAMAAAIARAAGAFAGTGSSTASPATASAGGDYGQVASLVGSVAVAALSKNYGQRFGGIADLSRRPVQRMSGGGIADSSEFRVGRNGVIEYGEAGPEAYIPLGQDRKVPVKMQGSAGQTIIINAMDGQDVERVLMRHRRSMLNVNRRLAEEHG